MKALLARLLTAFRKLSEPAPPRCKQCGTTQQLAPGADFCAACAHGTAAEQAAYRRSVDSLARPARRRDDPRP